MNKQVMKTQEYHCCLYNKLADQEAAYWFNE